MAPIKVVLLGSSKVGKTCLTIRYVHGTYEEDTEMPTTIGAMFRTKTINIEGQEVTFNIYDTGGEVKYEKFAPSFIFRSKAVVICFELKNQDSVLRAKELVNQVYGIEPDAKIYLCITKADQGDRKLLTFSNLHFDMPAFAEMNGIPLFETSSLDNTGINDLFNRIASDYLDGLTRIESDQLKHKKNAKRKMPWWCPCPCSMS